MDQITMEMNEPELHSNSTNGDDGLVFSRPWNSHRLLEETEEALL
jgi:hypothetical protein